MAIERRLIEIAGPVGGKLHTARSRNDQVATDLAMFVLEQARAAHDAAGELMGALLDRAEEHLDWPLPGYTHLQRAQPVYLAHHLLAYFWMLARDRERFAFALEQAGRLPLGAGALAGVSFDTDRHLVARQLGFHEIVPNSIDAVSNRDFALDYLTPPPPARCTSRAWARSWCWWSSQEVGFCELPDAWSAGSSIMPQKKNPDAAELLRAKAPRILGHYAALHGVFHALPLTYNKDMQEDKEHLFDTADTLMLTLAAARGMILGVRFSRERMSLAASDELLGATDLADMLVAPRRALSRGPRDPRGARARALESGRNLSELTPAELSEHSPVLGAHSRGVSRAAHPELVAGEQGLRGRHLQRPPARAGRARPRRARSPARRGAQRPLGVTKWPAPPSSQASRCVRPAPPRPVRCPWSSTSGPCSRSPAL